MERAKQVCIASAFRDFHYLEHYQGGFLTVRSKCLTIHAWVTEADLLCSSTGSSMQHHQAHLVNGF